MELLALLGVVLVALAAHAFVVPVSMAFMSSDFGVFPLVAEDFRHGIWRAFYYQQPYGGVYLSVVRAGWATFLEKVFGVSFVTAHLTFTYLVIPALLAAAAYVLVRCYASRAGALFAALWVAFGFHFLVSVELADEFHMAYLLLGFVLLAWRARIADPWRSLSPRALFGAAVLSGFALYTCRASFIFVAAFFATPEIFSQVWHSVSRTKDRVGLWLRRLAVFFAVFYGYLRFLGEDLGAIGGRHVKLHAEPNFYILLFLIAAASVWAFYKKRGFDFPVLKKGATVFAGLLVGLAPEIYERVFHAARYLPVWGGGPYEIMDVAKLVVGFPDLLRKLFGVEGHLFSQFLLVLLILAAMALARFYKKNPARALPLVLSGFLALYAYFTVHTYVLGPPRYFLPALPALCVGMGLLWDFYRKIWPRVGLLFLLCACGWMQVSARVDLVRQVRASGLLENQQALVAAFQKQNVPVVITDDFWKTNQLSFLSRGRPWFVSTGRPWGPPQAFDLARSGLARVGILLSGNAQNPATIMMLGRRWELRLIQKIGGNTLFLGRPIH